MLMTDWAHPHSHVPESSVIYNNQKEKSELDRFKSVHGYLMQFSTTSSEDADLKE